MSNKQTATSWLIERLTNRQNGVFDGFPTMSLDEIYAQAKAMEKEQKIEFSKQCLNKALDTDIRTAHLKVEEYYTETYER